VEGILQNKRNIEGASFINLKNPGGVQEGGERETMMETLAKGQSSSPKV